MVELLVSGTVLFFLDQAAKQVVEARAPAGREIRCGPLFSIRHVASRRRFYRWHMTRPFLVAVWLGAFASSLVLVSGSSSFSSPASMIGLGAALGGAASNLTDIVRSRYVRDFIDLGWWPVFNIADVAIIGGLALAFALRQPS